MRARAHPLEIAMTSPHVYSMLDKHKRFVVLTALGFALLYAELGLFAHLAWRARSDTEAALIIGGVFICMLIVFLAACVPAKSFTIAGVEQQGSLVLPRLMSQFGQSAIGIFSVSVICFVVYLYLVGYDLVAATALLNNLFVFTLAGAGLLHGL